MELKEIEAVKARAAKGVISKRATINRKLTSYMLKHIAERDMGVYISNESLIQALKELDFRLNKITRSPNYYFNITMNYPRVQH